MKLSILAIVFVMVTVEAQNTALFWNLYEAVARGSRIMHDVTEGVGAVSKAIAAIDTFLDMSAQNQITDALSDAEEPKDDATVPEPTEPTAPPAKPEEMPKFNGCGALGFHIKDDNLPVTKLTACCGKHDACYSASCKANKRQCDYTLRSCLFSVCDKGIEKSQVKVCKGAAKLLFSGTMVLSNQQYADNQMELNCPSKKKKNEDRRNKKKDNRRQRR